MKPHQRHRDTTIQTQRQRQRQRQGVERVCGRRLWNLHRGARFLTKPALKPHSNRTQTTVRQAAGERRHTEARKTLQNCAKMRQNAAKRRRQSRPPGGREERGSGQQAAALLTHTCDKQSDADSAKRRQTQNTQTAAEKRRKRHTHNTEKGKDTQETHQSENSALTMSVQSN